MLYFTNHFLHADVLTQTDVSIKVSNSVKLSYTYFIVIQQMQTYFFLFIKMLKVGKVIGSTTSRTLVSWNKSYNNTTRGGWSILMDSVPSHTIQQLEGHCVLS
jgi:hypothetical protein